jgi:nicotinate phosphoribosyltransferase
MENAKCSSEKDGAIVPKMKISENVEKITNPGFKKVYRLFDKDSGRMVCGKRNGGC